MDDITPGVSAEVTAVVGIEDTAVTLGSGDVDVLGTPRVVALVEAAAVAAVAGSIDPEHTSVGTHIDLRHLAPSPIGAVVTARAEVSAVGRHTIVFAVSARMDDTTIADGSHVRAVVRRKGFGS